MNPFLFVVGCPRSGTTLLQRMLDNHPDLAVANDTHFVVRALDDVDPAQLTLTTELVDRVVSYRRFTRLGVPEATARRLAEGCSTYDGFVATLYDEFARRHGKAIAGEKTPDYVRHLPLLHRLFPAAPVVHIVRDGRDVALSVLEWAHATRGPGRIALWQQEPVAVAALWWRSFVTEGRAEGEAIATLRYREVRYEHLVADPEPLLRSLAPYLGLSYDSAMVNFHVGRTRDEPGLSAKQAWRPVTAGLRDWRGALPPRDLQLFEALAGEALEQFGYARACDTIPDEITDLADRCRRWWSGDRSGGLPGRRLQSSAVPEG